MWYTKYGPTTMQGWKGCDQLQTNQTITLTDARDNNQYTVAKLLDGRCWMTQNLRLGGNVTITLHPEDTDIDTDFTLPASTSQDFGQDDNRHFVGSYKQSSLESNENGTYYSWYAAIADSYSETDNEADASICPKTFKLPTYQEALDFINQYNPSTAQREPAKFIQAGYFIGRGLYTGSGSYWTKTNRNGRIKPYYIFLNNNSLSFGADNGWNVTVGISVRCIFGHK